jgi:hypothetical protein
MTQQNTENPYQNIHAKPHMKTQEKSREQQEREQQEIFLQQQGCLYVGGE